MRANAPQKTFLSKRKLYQRNIIIFAAQKQVFGEVLLHQNKLVLD
jgi:hypothetical protein